MQIVTGDEMAAVDRRAADEYGFPSLVLMENAGGGAHRLLRSRYWRRTPPDLPVVYIAGKGNNGGDALVMARHAWLDGMRGVSVVLASHELRSETELELGMVRSLGIPVFRWSVDRAAADAALRAAAWIVDGLSGTGLSGALRPPYDEIVEAINASGAKVAAVDLPSGLGDRYRPGWPAVQASLTLTMGLPKLCMYLPAARTLCGRIEVIDPGFPPALLEGHEYMRDLLESRELHSLLAPIPPDTFKNRRGTLAVFAGAPGTTGAAELCSTAALRSRAGLVTLFTDDASHPTLASRLTSVMVRRCDPAEPEFEFSRYAALLVGPGWGLGPERLGWLSRCLESGLPGVLDADGLTLFGRLIADRPMTLGGRWVLTPHPGEFLRLLRNPDHEAVTADPVSYLLEASRALEAVIVLKGHVTMAASPDGRLAVLDGMNPALATGGTGDILAGIIAGVLSGGAAPEDAARIGLLVHREIGRRAYAERGWFLSEDLLPYISRAFKQDRAGGRRTGPR